MIKAIVFDCFGVLVGSSFWDIYRAAGGDTEKDAAFIAEVLARANAGLMTSMEFNAAVAAQLGVGLQEWKALAARMEQPNETLFAFIRRELKPRYKLAVLSNANKGSLKRRLPAEKLALFDAIIVSGEVGFLKPQPEIFRLTAERLGVTFDEMVFVDDLERYVAAAGQLGIQAILYQGQADLKKQLSRLLTTSKTAS
jgi:glucose-1-phosphatase